MKNTTTIFLFILILLFGFASNINAGSVIRGPGYIGLSDELVASWPFDGNNFIENQKTAFLRPMGV